MDERCNFWPNRETWLAACWPFTRRYGELMQTSREMWRNTARPGRGQCAAQLAYRMRAMVEMA